MSESWNRLPEDTVTASLFILTIFKNKPDHHCVGLIVHAISFQDFQPVIPIHQRHGQTDRQTDRRHAIARSRFALQYIAR